MPLLRSWEWWRGSCLMQCEAFLFLLTETSIRNSPKQGRENISLGWLLWRVSKWDSVRFPWHRSKEVNDSCNFKWVFVGDTVNCPTRGFVCIYLVLRAGIPEPLTRGFLLGLGFGPSKSFALGSSKFQPLWICKLLNVLRYGYNNGFGFLIIFGDSKSLWTTGLTTTEVNVSSCSEFTSPSPLMCCSHLMCTPFLCLHCIHTQIHISGIFLSFEILEPVAPDDLKPTLRKMSGVCTG